MSKNAFAIAVALRFPAAAGLGTSGCNHIALTSPSPMVVGAKDLGPIATNPDILGRDGGYSALFQGESVWIYGDTFLAHPDAEGFTLISDSWSYTSDLTAENGFPDSRNSSIPWVHQPWFCRDSCGTGL